VEIKFTSLKELYVKIKPALTSKKEELSRIGLNHIKEEDIWNYLKETKWGKTTNLSLAEMVNDILNTDNDKIETYVKIKMKEMKRNLNLEDF
jgi:RecB family exonuclease